MRRHASPRVICSRNGEQGRGGRGEWVLHSRVWKGRKIQSHCISSRIAWDRIVIDLAPATPPCPPAGRTRKRKDATLVVCRNRGDAGIDGRCTGPGMQIIGAPWVMQNAKEESIAGAGASASSCKSSILLFAFAQEDEIDSIALQ